MNNKFDHHSIQTVGIIGTGVIGSSWIALFLSHGLRVLVSDPAPNASLNLAKYIDSTWPLMQRIGLREGADPKNYKFVEDVADHLDEVDFVQENAPERVDFKSALFAKLDARAPSHVVLASSSSGIPSSSFISQCTHAPERILIGHPFNPPHLMPLVEVVPHSKTASKSISTAIEFYKSLGKQPILINQETLGFVANRLQVAILSEAISLVARGVVTAKDVDTAMTASLGPRWAANGPLMSQVLGGGGGKDGFVKIQEHLGGAMKGWLEDMNKNRMMIGESDVVRRVDDSIQEWVQTLDLDSVAEERDETILQLLNYRNTLSAEKKHENESQSPEIFFLDVGLSREPSKALSAGRILRGSVDGSAPSILVENQRLPDGIAISRSLRRLFWTCMGTPDVNDGAVYSSTLNGTEIRTVIPPGGIHTGKQCYIDEQNQSLYIADREGLRVLRCNLDGSNLETLIQTGDWHNPEHIQDKRRWCVGVAVCRSSKEFYWTQKGASKGHEGRIFRAGTEAPHDQNSSTRNDIECVLAGLPEPIDLEIDEASGHLYWTDRGELPLGNSVNRASLASLHPCDEGQKSVAGKDYELLIRNLNEAIGLGLDEKRGHIYVTDLGGAVYRFDKDGKNKRKLYEEQGALTGIALIDR